DHNTGPRKIRRTAAHRTGTAEDGIAGESDMYYPILMKVADRRVVVIGGGMVAEEKVRSLLEAAARIRVVSPAFTPALRLLAESGAISLEQREYERADIADALLVIAATNDKAVQQRVWDDARARNILVNTVDEPERCDFITPGVIRRGDLIVTVSTSGKSP